MRLIAGRMDEVAYSHIEGHTCQLKQKAAFQECRTIPQKDERGGAGQVVAE
jgi:hypothetical protein